MLQNLAPQLGADSPAGPGAQRGHQGGADGKTSSGVGAEFEGVARSAAVGGLLRSLHQLGAGFLLQALQEQLGGGGAGPWPGSTAASAAGAAMHAAAASMGQWGSLAPGSPGVGGGAQQGAASSTLALAFGDSLVGGPSAGSIASFDASLGAAVGALAAGSSGRCQAAVWSASRELVAGLVSASLEGAANVNTALVQLQILQASGAVAWWDTHCDWVRLASCQRRQRVKLSGTASYELHSLSQEELHSP